MTEEEMQIATLQADVQKLQAALEKANANAKGHRLTAEEAVAERDAIRKEADGLRGKQQQTQNDFDAFKAERMSKEAELASAHEKVLADLRGEVDRTAIGAEVRVAAVKAGVQNADDMLKLIDLTGIKRGEDGKLTGVDETVTAFKDSRPFMFGEAPKPGTVTGTTGSPASAPRPAALSTFDARTATPADAQAQARALGITTSFT